MTTYRYRVTGEETRVIAELSHGPEVVVERDGTPLVGYELVDDREVEVPLDSTVVVEPGDVLSCPVVLLASYLAPEDPATADAVTAAQGAPAVAPSEPDAPDDVAGDEPSEPETPTEPTPRGSRRRS